jgi:hypothetical protein
MRKPLLLLALALSAACSAPADGPTPRRAGGDAPIVAQELSGLGPRDALSAVRTLRPRWLRTVPQTVSGNDGIVVYFNNVRLGGVEALTQFSTADIGEIQYLRAPQAQLRFGPGHLNGAIVITPLL